MKVTKVKLFQQANGYWRWGAFMNGTKLANTSKPYSNYPDAVANLMAVVSPRKRKIPVTVTKKDGSKGVLPT